METSQPRKISEIDTFVLISYMIDEDCPSLKGIPKSIIIRELRSRGVSYDVRVDRRERPLIPIEEDAIRHLRDGWPINAVSAKFNIGTSLLRTLLSMYDVAEYEKNKKRVATKQIRPEL